jgi:hypothetical protein
MPNTNTANLSGVYVRYHDTATFGGVSEDAIKDNLPFDIVFALEAGANVFGMPAAYTLHVFPVPPALITHALDGHAFQVVGVMSVGKNDPMVEAKLSEIFIITQA